MKAKYLYLLIAVVALWFMVIGIVANIYKQSVLGSQYYIIASVLIVALLMIILISKIEGLTNLIMMHLNSSSERKITKLGGKTNGKQNFKRRSTGIRAN